MTNRPRPDEALERLREGNLRFLEGRYEYCHQLGHGRLEELRGGQSPYAVVLACADSRTPPEHIFDTGLGDLFVCRNAGNQLHDTVLGSVEYAALDLGCPLLVVMGHSSCGAFGAAVHLAKNPEFFETQNIDALLRNLLPMVLAAQSKEKDDKTWINEAASKHVDKVCHRIGKRSAVLHERIERGEFKVVGAWFDIATGKVEFRTYD